MKLTIILTIGLMSFGCHPVLSMPSVKDEEVLAAELEDDGRESELQSLAALSATEWFPEIEYHDDVDLQDLHGAAELQDVHGLELQAFDFAGEMRMSEIPESEPPLPEDDDIEMQATSNKKILRCGSTVGMRLLSGNQWLTCRSTTCSGNTCPGRFFDTFEMTKCSPEVFEIWQLTPSYKRRTKGWYICNGALVQIYYRKTGNSLQAAGSSHFRIFARGKKYGAQIKDQDTVAFYHVNSKKYVRFLENRAYLSSSCMGIGKFPPSSSKFDTCVNNSVEVSILG